MWIYEQISGRLYQDTDLETVYVGYSGHGEGKNNPDLQHVKNVGPCPVGFYEVGAPYDSIDHGPYVMRLKPSPDNEMHGRGSFLVHGDSKKAPGDASHGCLVFSRGAREALGTSGDRWLKVVATGA